jgi:hypothetical protein
MKTNLPIDRFFNGDFDNMTVKELKEKYPMITEEANNKYPEIFYSIYRQIKAYNFKSTFVICEEEFVPMQKLFDKRLFTQFFLDQGEKITEYTKDGFFWNGKLIVFINKNSLFMI